jgi:hypothetical protein
MRLEGESHFCRSKLPDGFNENWDNPCLVDFSARFWLVYDFFIGVFWRDIRIFRPGDANYYFLFFNF